MVKVSVVVPVYNVADYVECCILSVMRQSYQKIECIIVDDASDDDSIVICERLIAGYEGPIEFRIIHHEYNRGLSVARNIGTLAAGGEYIFYLDSDDELTDNCFELFAAAVEKYPGIDIVQGNTASNSGKYMDRYTHQIYVPYLSSNEEIRRFWFGRKQFGLTAWNKLIRREFILSHKLFFEKSLLFEDALWNFYLQKYLNTAYFVKEITYHYRNRPGSIMFSTSRQAVGRHYSYIMCNILNNLTEGKEKEEIKFYSSTFSLLYPRCQDAYPRMNFVWNLFWQASGKYHIQYVRVWLIVSRFLSMVKFGKILLPFIRNSINTLWNLQNYLRYSTLKLTYRWIR